MAENFLSQLLRIENSVQSNESQHCYICMSEIGTLCSATGVIECAISLPCNPNHKVGSACIATWLELNNTCPICRRELFPLTEDHTNEDGTDRDDTDEDEEEPIGSEADNEQYIESRRAENARNARLSAIARREADNEQYIESRRAENARTARMSALIHTCCVALHLDDSVIRYSTNIGDVATRTLSLTGRSETVLAAASVYLASHLRYQPKTLREIAQLVGTNEGAIQTVYRRLYAHYHNFTTSTGSRVFGYPPGYALLPNGARLLDWPPLQHEYVDGENGQDEESIQELWSHFTAELELQPAVTSIARTVAYNLESWPSLAGCDAKSFVSIGIFLASYAAGAPESPRLIAEVAGFAPSYLLTLYRHVYGDREQLLAGTIRASAWPFAFRPF